MAVASGSTRAMVERTLRQLGVLDWFECLVAAEDTERHKPEPDVFLEAARRLRVDPQRCCVYEDTDTGVEAAHRAGMDCVDIRTLYTPQRQDDSS
jgi:HAD superfamily hydrolase (TIGR01509 family)